MDVDENQAVTFTLTDEKLIKAVAEDHLEKISDDSGDARHGDQLIFVMVRCVSVGW